MNEITEQLQPFVNHVNEYIKTVNEIENENIDFISVSDIINPLVDNFVDDYAHSSLEEMLVKVNPYLAVELGF